MTQARVLIACGVAMPFIYLCTLAVSHSLNPGFDLIYQEPSQLGSTGAKFPFVYNVGMVATAVAGLLASFGLMTSRNIGGGSLWGVWTGVSIFLASIGIAMAGFFPLPSHLHYGFGFTTAAILTPLLGAVLLWRSGSRSAGMVLISGFFLILGLVAWAASPLGPGAVMFASISYLCGKIRDRTGRLPRWCLEVVMNLLPVKRLAGA